MLLALARLGGQGPQARVARAVRGGVLLTTGTLLLTMAVAATFSSTLRLPHWNWISFLGITIPGILFLIAYEDLRCSAGNTRPARAGLGILLVAGISLLVWGSTSNLTLGVDGFHRAVPGSWPGTTLWVLGAVVLAALFSQTDPGRRRSGWHVALGLWCSAAIIAAIIGERAFLLASLPRVALGVHLIAVGALTVGGFSVISWYWDATTPERARQSSG